HTPLPTPPNGPFQPSNPTSRPRSHERLRYHARDALSTANTAHLSSERGRYNSPTPPRCTNVTPFPPPWRGRVHPLQIAARRVRNAPRGARGPAVGPCPPPARPYWRLAAEHPLRPGPRPT